MSAIKPFYIPMKLTSDVYLCSSLRNFLKNILMILRSKLVSRFLIIDGKGQMIHDRWSNDAWLNGRWSNYEWLNDRWSNDGWLNDRWPSDGWLNDG